MFNVDWWTNHTKGIGNGISLIIFAGIVSAIPSAIGGTIDLVNNGQMNF